MPKGVPLSEAERAQVVSLLARGRPDYKIAAALGRDVRTIRKFISNHQDARKKKKSGHFLSVSPRDIRKIHLIVSRKSYLTSKEIFEKAGLPNVPKTTRCRILKSLATVRTKQKRPVLTKIHKEKRLKWARQYLKQDFSKVIWTDESRVTLDGPDGWSRGWILPGKQPETMMRRQQGGGGIMIWAGIVGSSLVGPFMIPEGVKVNKEVYCNLLQDSFLPWFQSLPGQEKSEMIFMHDNAPGHAAKYTTEWLSNAGFGGDKLMVWPPNSPDLNPIEHFWAILKRKVYAENQQYNSLKSLWRSIKRCAASILPEEISALTKSVDQRLVSVLEAKGGHFK